jgi:hypothetical protein
MGILDELTKKRLKWVDANRENGFEKGLRQLLTKLYPDNAHFIYELMQNAEDPRASKVRFALKKDSLEFEHNGEKLFTLKDVESITSIGTSSKLDDPTNIGEFGVGFKAVFDYTNTPEIHSGEFHFRIKDLVVPETNGVMKPKMGNRETRFSFPFDHPNKPPAQAKAEIERTLINLGDNTLLFLSHICSIEYLLADGSFGSLERLDHGGGRIEIHTRHPSGSQTITHWLRFQNEVEVQDENGETERRIIAIAYRLEGNKDNEKNNNRRSDWVITPLDNGQVSIYFPAEKEASNLRFHIHAPFASTVARDSVRNCQANHQLLNHIANLVVESLPIIRDEGMLTVNFLGVLPNPMDTLSQFYEPIRAAVVCAFKDKSLTPTKIGTHAPAADLYRGPAKISEVLNDTDLSLLTHHKPPLWAANPPQHNQREDRFLDSLEIAQFGWSELVEKLQIPHPWALESDSLYGDVAREHKERIESWLEEKNDAWMIRFYALLGESFVEHGESFDNYSLRLVRVEADQGCDHVLPEEAYFAPEHEVSPPEGVYFVKPSVYSKGRSDAQKRYAGSFLQHIGVRPFDARTVIELKLKFYEVNPPNPIKANYYKDINQFISHFNNNAKDVGIFRGQRFLQGLDCDGDILWCEPDELCLDSPYVETGLAGLTEIHDRYAVAHTYKNNFSKTKQDDFVSFLKAIGVMHKLEVGSVSTAGNINRFELRQDYSKPYVKWTASCIDEDFSIPGIRKYIEAQSFSASRLLWNALISADRKASLARFRPNQQYQIRKAESQLISDLKLYAWVPDKSGIFQKPSEMTQDRLRNDFPYDDSNGLLTAIGFGVQAKQQNEIYNVRNSWAVSEGFNDINELEEYKIFKDQGGTFEDLQKARSARQCASQPEESAPNPVRRRNGVLERRQNAPSRDSVTRERVIQPGARWETNEARAYLRNKYKNSNDQLMCQCCRAEMPFKVRGEHYFEAVQCVRGLDYHFFENRLALCPNCAAMYQHARQTDDDELTRSIIEHEAPDSASFVEIMVILAGRNINLRFVGTHWLDLKTVLNE